MSEEVMFAKWQFTTKLQDDLNDRIFNKYGIRFAGQLGNDVNDEKAREIMKDIYNDDNLKPIIYLLDELDAQDSEDVMEDFEIEKPEDFTLDTIDFIIGNNEDFEDTNIYQFIFNNPGLFSIEEVQEFSIEEEEEDNDVTDADVVRSTSREIMSIIEQK